MICAGGNPISGTGGIFIPQGGGIGGSGGTVMYGLKGVPVRGNLRAFAADGCGCNGGGGA